MSMQLPSALLVAIAVAFPLVARAQPIDGLYIGAGGGVNIMQNESDKSLNGFVTPGKQLEFDTGATGVGSAGWGFGNGLRAELELDYRYNGLTGVIFPNGGSRSLGGSEQKYGPMANILYDFNGLSPAFVPYIGAGAGYQFADMNLSAPRAASGTAGSFAYQAIIGAAIPVASVSGLAVTTEYRFMGLPGDRAYAGNGFTVTRNNDYNNSILIGLRYAFGSPPLPPAVTPVPMTIPAPAPARSYLVFFDWDKAALTTRAQQIIREAADNAGRVQHTRIEVSGYTDTSGTPQYNQGLSLRRAEAVAAELVKDGVSKAAIAIQGFGETHPLVPTGSSAREPQNRRVEIVIR